jgi:hypothetical protein
MATLEFNMDHNDDVVSFAYDGEQFLACLSMSKEAAWDAYRNLQRVLVGPYKGRNGKYNGN